MGRKSNGGKKIKVGMESFDQLKKTEPNSTLIHLYEQRNSLLPSDIVSRLSKLTLNRSPSSWRIHPMNVETIWHILGYICDVTYSDEELKSIARVIENRKLYNQFDMCHSFILQENIHHAEKKERLEKLFIALCKTTPLYLTVAKDASKFIRPCFFLDLLNGTRNPSLKFKSVILKQIEFIHSMVTVNKSNASEDVGDRVNQIPNLSTDVPPDDVTEWNIVPTHQDILWLEAIFLRPNFVHRPYPDLETYKDVQFRLLMEDFMRPMRQGMHKLMNGELPKSTRELRIYHCVTVKFIQSQLLIPEREKSWRFYSANFKRSNTVNWSTSRRLITGSLVCLWDGSNQLIIATVADR